MIISEVFPNPASSEVFVNLEKNISGKLSVLDLQGRIVLSVDVLNRKSISLDVSNIQAGNYFIEIENETESNKLIKKLVIVK